jgi:hypothetical protein
MAVLPTIFETFWPDYHKNLVLHGNLLWYPDDESPNNADVFESRIRIWIWSKILWIRTKLQGVQNTSGALYLPLHNSKLAIEILETVYPSSLGTIVLWNVLGFSYVTLREGKETSEHCTMCLFVLIPYQWQNQEVIFKFWLLLLDIYEAAVNSSAVYCVQ